MHNEGERTAERREKIKGEEEERAGEEVKEVNGGEEERRKGEEGDEELKLLVSWISSYTQTGDGLG